MATTITKTYTVKVDYTKNDDEETLTAAHVNVVFLRALIMRLIDHASVVSMGEIDAHINTAVVES